MARSRKIPSSLYDDKALASVSLGAFTFLISLYSHLDRQGLIIARPRYLAALCFPSRRDITPKRVEGWIKELEGTGHIFVFAWGCENFLLYPEFSRTQFFFESETERYKIPGETLKEMVRLRKLGTDPNSDERKQLDMLEPITMAPKKIQNPEVYALIEEAYKLYPRKIGKTVGMKRAAKEIKTVEDAKLFQDAIKAFCAHLKAMGTEERFIPYFSTFITSWRDWLEPVFSQEFKPKVDW